MPEFSQYHNNAATICILGGGFGGLFTALRLSQLPWPPAQAPNIILIDQHDHFLFTPLLYELVTAELQAWEIAPPFTELLAQTNVRFHQGTVEQIDLDAHTVTLVSAAQLTYDYLVLALGGETPQDQVPGAAEHAYPFRTLTDAYRLQERLKELEASTIDKIRVAIVGGGPSGVELACKLADRLAERGRVRIIERGDRLLGGVEPGNRQAAEKALEKRGVWQDLNTQVQAVRAHQIDLCYQAQVETLEAELVLWTVGNAIAPPIETLPAPHNPQGQLLTRSTLQVQDHDNIFALGDLASCEDATGKPMASTAQVALQQADCAAWNVWASVTDRPLLKFRYTHLGEMLTLGQDSAALAGLGLQLDGPLAYLARRLIYLYRMPTLEHQLKVGLNWLLKPITAGIESTQHRS